jgi:hypothetical protein
VGEVGKRQNGENVHLMLGSVCQGFRRREIFSLSLVASVKLSKKEKD